MIFFSKSIEHFFFHKLQQPTINEPIFIRFKPCKCVKVSVKKIKGKKDRKKTQLQLFEGF